jgi:hypothetical protein
VKRDVAGATPGRERSGRAQPASALAVALVAIAHRVLDVVDAGLAALVLAVGPVVLAALGALAGHGLARAAHGLLRVGLAAAAL